MNRWWIGIGFQTPFCGTVRDGMASEARACWALSWTDMKMVTDNIYTGNIRSVSNGKMQSDCRKRNTFKLTIATHRHVDSWWSATPSTVDKRKCEIGNLQHNCSTERTARESTPNITSQENLAPMLGQRGNGLIRQQCRNIISLQGCIKVTTSLICSPRRTTMSYLTRMRMSRELKEFEREPKCKYPTARCCGGSHDRIPDARDNFEQSL